LHSSIKVESCWELMEDPQQTCLLETESQINLNLFMKEFTVKGQEPHLILEKSADMWDTIWTSKLMNLEHYHLSNQLLLQWEKSYTITRIVCQQAWSVVDGTHIKAIKSIKLTHQVSLTKVTGLSLVLGQLSFGALLMQITNQICQSMK